MTGRRMRVRQRFLNEGLDSFAPHEALELMLFYIVPRADVNPLAHRLIDAFGTLNGVLEAPIALLKDIDGVSDATATYLHLLPAFARYINRERKKDTKVQLSNIKDAAEFCAAQLEGRANESFLLVCLNAQNRITGHRVMWEGTVDETPAYPRQILMEAMRLNARTVIIAHNHPGGSSRFSEADVIITEQIRRALAAISIDFFDHFIIMPDGSYIQYSQLTNEDKRRMVKLT